MLVDPGKDLNRPPAGYTQSASTKKWPTGDMFSYYLGSGHTVSVLLKYCTPCLK